MPEASSWARVTVFPACTSACRPAKSRIRRLTMKPSGAPSSSGVRTSRIRVGPAAGACAVTALTESIRRDAGTRHDGARFPA